MGDLSLSSLTFRPLVATDIGQVPMSCFGGVTELADRIRELGAAAILAFDGGQHVAQLQFRKHLPGLRSREGIFNPDWWGDFTETNLVLPDQTLCLYCYHVGQLTDGDARDAKYQGRGLGAALLDHLIDWADVKGFHAIVAKAVPAVPAVMRFMGGQPGSIYALKGFNCIDRWVDRQMYDALVGRELVPEVSDFEGAATVELYIRELSARKNQSSQ